ILGVAAGIWYLWQSGTKPAGTKSNEGPDPNMIQMEDVRIEVFDDNFKQTAELRGKTATTFKNNPDLILEPADCVLIRTNGHNVHITSAKAHKIVKHNAPDVLEFTGDANVETEGRHLLSEK